MIQEAIILRRLFQILCFPMQLMLLVWFQLQQKNYFDAMCLSQKNINFIYFFFLY